MSVAKKRKDDPSLERLAAPGETAPKLQVTQLVPRAFGEADNRPIWQQLGMEAGSRGVLTLPLSVCVLGRHAQGWLRAGSLAVSEHKVEAAFLGGDVAWAPAWRFATGAQWATGDGDGVVVFAVDRGGRKLRVAQTLLTEVVIAAGTHALRQARTDHPLLRRGRRDP